MASILLKRPVAFRWKMATGGWFFSANEALAAEASDGYQGLYVRDGTAIVAEWQPIETAPRDDGKCVLVYRPTAEREKDRIGIDYWNSGKLYAAPCWMKSRPHEQPTHWMPLPAAPENTAT